MQEIDEEGCSNPRLPVVTWRLRRTLLSFVLSPFLMGLSHMIQEGSGVDERRKQELCFYSSIESSVSKALYFLGESWL